MPRLTFFLIMLLVGAVSALQPSINSRLAERVGLLESAFISFSVGTFVLLALVLTVGRGDLRTSLGASWWEWTGGLLGAVYVTGLILVVPRIGTAAALSAGIAAQLLTGLLLDHYGGFGLDAVPLTPTRLTGVFLLFCGALLVLRR